MINQVTIDKIIDTARIEDVVQDFVPLKRRGVNLIGLCPFHKEKTPSFSVSPEKQIFHSFVDENEVVAVIGGVLVDDVDGVDVEDEQGLC